MGPTQLPLLNSTQYELWVHQQSSLGARKHTFVAEGAGRRRCRFCGSENPKNFRKKAHLLPEGLGNKWLFNRDECDDCNEKFGQYESDLCASVGSLLTIGGVKGKKRVRQTGSTKSGHTIRHKRSAEGGRHLSYRMKLEDRTVQGTQISFLPDQKMVLTYPSPREKFVPINAYKALAKIGFSLLPETYLREYSKLSAWINVPSSLEAFPFLDVGISVGSLGNSPGIASASLLKRRSGLDDIPHAIAVICCGSICWQLDLMADTLDDGCDLIPFGFLNLNWKSILGTGTEKLDIEYTSPTHFDLKGREPELPLVAALRHVIDLQDQSTRIDAMWRD